MAVLVKNNAYSTLASGITAIATTITVAAGTGLRFPAAGGADYFYATLIDTSNNLEIVKVTARSTDTLTVVRAQDGTTARAYSSGSRIELRITAALIQDIRDGITPGDGTVTAAKIVSDAVETTKIANDAVTLAKLAAAVQQALTPTGSLMPYAGTTAPSGWLLCFGQNVSRSTYAALFAVLGTTYGAGDGSTTFALPDLRGRVIAGQDDMGGTSANRLTNQSGGLDGDTLGATGGAETHTLTIAQMPLHGHPVRISGSAAADPTGGFITDSDVDVNYPAYSGTPTATLGQQIGGTGGDAPHNNVQPTIILNYIIKT
jgi:microcystin-dependent protein